MHISDGSRSREELMRLLRITYYLFSRCHIYHVQIQLIFSQLSLGRSSGRTHCPAATICVYATESDVSASIRVSGNLKNTHRIGRNLKLTPELNSL
jgi:hypothetical protein